MPRKPNPALTDELLNKLLYIGEDGKLYRKVIEHMGFCSVTPWNALAFHAKPIEISSLSLKVIGLHTYRIAFIFDAVRMGVGNAYAKQKKIALRATEKNLDKAVKAQKQKHATDLEKINRRITMTTTTTQKRRDAKKALLCKNSEDKDLSCRTCAHRNTSWCAKHKFHVHYHELCENYSCQKDKRDKIESLKPTIAEVKAAARKTSNFRQAYLAALKAGAYRVQGDF